jgi:hypothetical protein
MYASMTNGDATRGWQKAPSAGPSGHRLRRRIPDVFIQEAGGARRPAPTTPEPHQPVPALVALASQKCLDTCKVAHATT